MQFADIILPLPIRDTFTYSVPEEFQQIIKPGHRVEVQFGSKKKYAGIVLHLHDVCPANHNLKPIINLLDEEPIINARQLRLWSQVAEYYVSSIGEVMNAALPAGIKVNSETIYIGHEALGEKLYELEGDEHLVASAILYQNEIRHQALESLLGRKNIYPVIKSLLSKGLIELKEVLRSMYKARTERVVIPRFDTSNESLNPVLELVKNARKQAEIILYCVQQLFSDNKITASSIEERFPGSNAALQALKKKGIIDIERRPVSRHGNDDEVDFAQIRLSGQQQQALDDIRSGFADKDIILLHGITGSGKTLIYLKLIEEVLARGEQVLLLVPEISLTTQLVRRFTRYFAREVSVYHSSIGSNHKIDLWHDISQGKPLVIGARSGVFLPFSRLSLIIMDEEHDPSFKQNDPAPKYHARETAFFLAKQHGAKILLGSATPSFETYHNALHGKYGLVKLTQRFGGARLPKVHLLNRNTLEHDDGKGSHFSPLLIGEMLSQLQQGRQSIVFINRRGYSTMLVCPMCEWTMRCKNCDVSMTYHKFHNKFLCHYCGWSREAEQACPECGNVDIGHKGLGTQKIEEELELLFPEARIARLDLDTVRSRTSVSELLQQMENGSIDILIGTQMVSKGLDFEGIGLVCIVSADQLARFPDFRAHERAFQLMVQVSGRSGRSDREGQVYIQYGNIRKSLLDHVTDADYHGFYTQEIGERRQFRYPPFCRLIRVTVGHRDPDTGAAAMERLAGFMRQRWGERLAGPAPALIPRINNQYLYELMIKMERKNDIILHIKKDLRDASALVRSASEFKSAQIIIDVDPY